MCCRSSAPPQALPTLTAAPGAAPDCLHLLRLRWTGTFSVEPSPSLCTHTHTHKGDGFHGKLTLLSIKKG